MAYLSVHMLIVIVATSYLTLGVFEPHRARALWAPYAAIIFVLAVVNMIRERRRG